MSKVQPPLLPAVRRRRSNRIALALLVVVLGVPLAVFLTWRLSLANDIRALEQKIRDAGEPLTLAELAATRPSVPDEENAAVALMDLWEEKDPDFWKSWRVGGRPSASPRSESIDTQLLVRTAQGITVRPLPWTEEQAAMARKLVVPDEDRRLRVNQALQKPHAEFPVQYEEGVHALMQHIPEVRNEVVLMQLAAQLAIYDQDTASALSALGSMEKLGDLFRNEPLVISQRVRLGAFEWVCDTAEQLLSQADPAMDEVGILTRLIERMTCGTAFSASLNTDRAFGLSLFSSRLRDLEAFLGVSEADLQNDGLAGWLRVEGFPFGWTGYFAKDRLFLLESVQDAIASAKAGTIEGMLVAARQLEAAGARAHK
jgi:hypothetical protein